MQKEHLSELFKKFGEAPPEVMGTAIKERFTQLSTKESVKADELRELIKEAVVHLKSGNEKEEKEWFVDDLARVIISATLVAMVVEESGVKLGNSESNSELSGDKYDRATRLDR